MRSRSGLLSDIQKKVRRSSLQYYDVADYLIGSRQWSIFIATFCTISLLFSMYGFSSFYQALIAGEAVAYRVEYYESGGEIAYGNIYLTVIRDLLLKPGSYLCLGLSVLGMKQKRSLWINRFVFLSAIFALLLFDAAQFGRTGIVNALFLVSTIILFAHAYQKRDEEQRDKKNRFGITNFLILTMVIFVLAGFVHIVSVQRQDIGLFEGLVKLLSYFTLGIALFDNKDFVLPDHFDGFIYSLGGLYQLINIFARRIGSDLLPSKTMDLQEFQSIGPDLMANALYTWNIAFYADLGAFGCIVFPFVFGLLVGRIYKTLTVTGAASSVLLLSVVMVVAYASVLEWRLMWADQLVLVIMAWATTRRTKRWHHE